MTVDHRIQWESDERGLAQALAGTIIAIFPVGVPLGLFILLYFNRDQIMQRQTRAGVKELEYIGAIAFNISSNHSFNINFTSFTTLHLPATQPSSSSSTSPSTGTCQSSTSSAV